MPRCRYLVIVDDPDGHPALAGVAFGVGELPNVSSRGKSVQELDVTYWLSILAPSASCGRLLAYYANAPAGREKPSSPA